jgi:hypothetical protein
MEMRTQSLPAVEDTDNPEMPPEITSGQLVLWINDGTPDGSWRKWNPGDPVPCVPIFTALPRGITPYDAAAGFIGRAKVKEFYGKYYARLAKFMAETFGCNTTVNVSLVGRYARRHYGGFAVREATEETRRVMESKRLLVGQRLTWDYDWETGEQVIPDISRGPFEANDMPALDCKVMAIGGNA